MPTHICALLVGAAIDLILGDPEWFPHPVRLIGKYIAFAEKAARRGNPTRQALRRRAVAVAASTVLLTAAVTAGILFLLGRSRSRPVAPGSPASWGGTPRA